MQNCSYIHKRHIYQSNGILAVLMLRSGSCHYMYHPCMHLAFDREKEQRFAGPEAGGLDWYIVQNPIIPGAIINSIYKWGYLYLYIYIEFNHR